MESGARFLAEARIQARLEHPSIVPVYDVGLDEAGDPYFTMKRINGQTLRRVLDSVRAGDPTAVAEYSRRRLLTAFATMCLTVDYAHKHDVIHRDLKPSNVMLGEYGELYVLDWGVARSARERAEASTPLALEGVGPETMEGDVVGTLGYMAPEQARGEPLDARADIYSLGAILFELLTLEPLHPRGDSQATMAAAFDRGIEGRPSVRAPSREVPPELEAICVKATAFDAADRYPTARALHEAVDRFLEGDRDVELRRGLAREHARLAQELAAQALASDDVAGRARAMAAVSRALAFDPSHASARRSYRGRPRPTIFPAVEPLAADHTDRSGQSQRPRYPSPRGSSLADSPPTSRPSTPHAVSECNEAKPERAERRWRRPMMRRSMRRTTLVRGPERNAA